MRHPCTTVCFERDGPMKKSKSTDCTVLLLVLAYDMATYSTDVFAPSDAIVANPEVSWEGE